MKFFKCLLVAPATLGFISPMAAPAGEINFADVVDYSSSKQVKRFSEFNISKEPITKNESLDAFESQINDFEAGSFSETTTLSGSASFQVGAVDESVISEAVTATYAYDIDLNTSFTGEDNLYVGIETGNGGAVDFALDSSGGGGEILSVTSMYYQFLLGDFEVAVGPKLDNDDLMPTTISKYSDSFFLGGSVLLDTGFYSAPGVTGSGLAVSRVFDNGFNVSGSLIGTDANNTGGFITKEGNDVITLSAGYDSDNYGLGLVYVDMDDICGFIADYRTCAALGVSGLASASSIGIGGYWTMNKGKTTLSLTFNSVEASVTGLYVEDIYDSQFSIDHEMGEGVLSASIKGSSFWNGGGNNDLVHDYVGEFAEIYYTYPFNDSLELIGGIAFAMPDYSGLTWIDRTAVGVGGVFKF